MQNPIFTGPLTLERCQVVIPDLPLSLRGLRIVQLSDFHFDGVQLTEALLNQVVAATNAQAPDLICLTGDFVVERPEAIRHLTPHLRQLRSTYGTYAVLGNHDLILGRSRQIITTALEAAGVTVLWNEIVYPWGPGLVLVGLADFWHRDFAPAGLLAGLDPALPRLVLSHNPDSAAQLQAWRIDLQLSGHSHGGQINLPLVGVLAKHLAALYLSLPLAVQRQARPLGLFARIMDHWEWASGLHGIGANQLYVNRGLGTYWPGRLFCPPELTVLTLV